jgi:ArsR family transcriptional regulator
LIIDLGSHDQDWVRESCGDLWLGFDNEDLDYWANKAGLTTEQSSYLGLRNGFQIQMRVFKKPAR